jgi:hypothetical protein
MSSEVCRHIAWLTAVVQAGNDNATSSSCREKKPSFEDTIDSETAGILEDATRNDLGQPSVPV